VASLDVSGDGLGRLEISDAFLARRRIVDRIARTVLFCAAALSVFVTVGIVYVLISESVRFR
jgi:phosphate transport system permease protein